MAKFAIFDAGNLALRPTETGVEATAGAARRVGAFYNQQAGAEEMLARETDRLGSMTQQLGRETGQLGAVKGAALAAEGRAIGSGIGAAGDAAVKYLDSQQISHGSAAYATLLQKTTKDWNDTVKNADPNDPTVADKFMTQLDQSLEDFKGNGFYTENGQKWAEAHVDALRQHFIEKTTSDMSTLAGQAARVNQQQTVNSLSATVHGDPSSIDFALASLKSSTEGIIAHSPNLRGVDAANARSEILQKGSEAIVKSAAIGYIEKTAKMPDWVTDPKYAPYVNGPELQMLQKAAQVQQKTELAAQKQIDLYNRQQADQKAHAQANKTFSDNVEIDPVTNEPRLKPGFFKDALAVARNNPDAPSASQTARTLLDWGEHQQNRKAAAVQSDPATRKDLTDRMFSTDNPTTEIQLMKAQIDGKLSKDDFTSMHRLVQSLNETPLKGEAWKDTMKAAHDQLVVAVPGIPGKDDIGAKNYALFAQSFIPQYIAKSRAGTLEPNALDLNDPNSMISKSLAPFKRTQAERMRDYVSGAGGLGGSATQPVTGGSGRMVGGVAVPGALGGIASLSYNPTRKLWRDDMTNKIYDADGKEVR